VEKIVEIRDCLRLSESKIREQLGESRKGLPIFVYECTDSTNYRAELYAKDGRLPALFIAQSQSAGRGRRGRSFSSCEGGLYMTIAFLPGKKAFDAVSVTTYAAVIIAEALEELTPLKPQIKWVNDIYIGKRKLAGILTQGSIDAESGSLSYAVIGVGINLAKRDFPSDVAEIATTVEDACGTLPDINTLAARIADRFFGELDKLGSKEIADRYRSRSFLVGKDIRVIKLSEEYYAHVVGITDACELILRRSDGKEEILATGEVSVRENI